jgi:hypothetical protein
MNGMPLVKAGSTIANNTKERVNESNCKVGRYCITLKQSCRLEHVERSS